MLKSSMRAAHEHFSCHYEDPSCLIRLKSAVYCLLAQMDPQFKKDIVYLCVGTDRATGDCLGPLVGTRLHALIPFLNLFGTLEKPSHAVNLPEVLEEIAHLYNNPLVVAIDASLGNLHRIGYITIKPGGLKPGTALNKVLPTVGEFHISAVVNVGGYLEQMVLQNTRLYVVYRMAELIAEGLYHAHLQHEQDRNHCLNLPAQN